MTHSNGIIFKSTNKLFVIENKLVYPKKFIVGFCGDTEVAAHILDFFINPLEWKPLKKYGGTEFVALTVSHKMFTFSDPTKWLPIKSKFYSIGSGSHFAMGAMETGMTPKEAVAVAIKLDKGSGKGVTFFDV